MRLVRVLKPIQSIEEVQASLDVFGGRIAGRLDGRHPEPPEGEALESPFSYQDVFADLGRDLESLRVKVVTAEDAHVRRLATAATVRRQAEDLAQALYDQQVGARQVLGGAFDSDLGFELAAVSGITPRTFKPLEEQVDQTVKMLRDPVAEPPEVKVPGVDVNFSRVADGLGETLAAFRTKRAELDRVRKGFGETQVLLDQALAEFQETFPWIAQALEAFARMVGERELADRIRTSIRRVTRRQGSELPGEGEASDQGSAGEAASEEAASTEETASDGTGSGAADTVSEETASDAGTAAAETSASEA